MKKTTVFVMTVIMLIVLAGCGKEDLTGKWVCTDEGSSEELELFSDGTGIFIEDSGSNEISWIAENGKFKITRSLGFLGESSGSFEYELKNDTLTFSAEDGETQTFKKE